MLTVPAVLLGILFQAVGSLPAFLCLWIAEQSLLVFAGWLTLFESIPLLQPLDHVHWTAWVFLVMGSVLALLPRGTRLRWLAVPCLVPVFAGTLLNTDEVVHIRVHDVGQGLAVTIDTPEGVVVYDTGVERVGEQVLFPSITRMGHRMIDTLIVSHNDEDHAAGVATLVRRIPVAKSFRSGCDEQRWYMAHVEFRLMSADGHVRQRNDSSCALMVSIGSFRMLIPGDVEKHGEEFLRQRLPGNVTVMVSPHHGSRTSSAPGFLNHFMHDVVVVSAGFANRFGHPHPEIVRRYRQRGMVVYTTADHGAVEVIVHKTGRYTISAARDERDYLWY